MYSAAQVGVSLPNSFSDVKGIDSDTGTSVSNLSLANTFVYGLKFGYYLESLKWLGFEAEVFNSNPNLKQQTATVSKSTGSVMGTVPGAAVRVLAVAPVNVVVRYQMGRLEPYAGVGLGIFMANLKDGATGLSSSNTNIGLNTQVGLRVFVSEGVALFGEWKYNRASFTFPSFTAVPAQSTGGGYRGEYSAQILVFGIGFHFD